MGSCFDHRVFDTDNREVALVAFYRWVEQDGYENGHSYSGTIASTNGEPVFLDKTCESIDEACELLERKVQKWGPPLAVRFIDRQVTNKDWEDFRKERAALKKKYDEVFANMNKTRELLLSSLKDGKTKLKTCPGCGSKLAKSHLKGLRCPLCDASLLTKAAEKKLSAAQEKYKKIESEYVHQNEPKGRPGDVKIMIGACCPS